MGPRRTAVVAALMIAATGCGTSGTGNQTAEVGTPTMAATAASSGPSAAHSAAVPTTGAATGGAATTAAGEQRYPDIVAVEITAAGDGVFDLAVTVSSPYDSPDRYADGWRVLAPDGSELGSHTLLHDHAGEQPFTRVQSGLAIPPDVTSVTVEGRDQQHGYGGETVTVRVPYED